MSSHIPVWDSTHIQFDDDEINFDNPYEPWKNITKLTKTVTTSIKGIQETLYKENKDRKNLIKEEHIAAALANRNLLRLTHTIQISSNKQFLAITFQNKQIMETFCTEPLLVRGFNITFSPRKKFPKKKTLKYQLSKYSGRNTRQTFNRIPITIRRHSWNPTTHTKRSRWNSLLYRHTSLPSQ